MPTLKSLRSCTKGATAGTTTGILENCAVLYFVFFISLAELVFFAMSGDLKSAVVFLLTGFLVAFFNKNMIVVLFFALVVSTIYKFGLRDMTRFREGMKSSSKKRKNGDGDNENEEEEEDEEDVEGYEELMEKLENINLTLENSMGAEAAKIPKKGKRSAAATAADSDSEEDEDSDGEEQAASKKKSSSAKKTVENFGEEAILSGSDTSSAKSMSAEIAKKTAEQMKELNKYEEDLRVANKLAAAAAAPAPATT